MCVCVCVCRNGGMLMLCRCGNWCGWRRGVCVAMADRRRRNGAGNVCRNMYNVMCVALALAAALAGGCGGHGGVSVAMAMRNLPNGCVANMS